MPGLPDDRVRKLLAKADVEPPVRDRMLALADAADAHAKAERADLQAEFGKHHVALIAGCNQFVRFYRKGEHAGRVEVPGPVAEHLPEDDALGPAIGGAVFAMFGWRSLDPMAIDAERLTQAVRLGLDRARQAKAAATLA